MTGYVNGDKEEYVRIIFLQRNEKLRKVFGLFFLDMAKSSRILFLDIKLNSLS